MKGKSHVGVLKMHISWFISTQSLIPVFYLLIYVTRVDSMNVRDDTEIDWKTLPDSDWNLWSAHSLQRRWLTMKRAIKGYEDMTHQGSSSGHLVTVTYPTSRDHGYPPSEESPSPSHLSGA